jgi:hypothetical protein
MKSEHEVAARLTARGSDPGPEAPPDAEEGSRGDAQPIGPPDGNTG